MIIQREFNSLIHLIFKSLINPISHFNPQPCSQSLSAAVVIGLRAKSPFISVIPGEGNLLAKIWKSDGWKSQGVTSGPTYHKQYINPNNIPQCELIASFLFIEREVGEELWKLKSKFQYLDVKQFIEQNFGNSRGNSRQRKNNFYIPRKFIGPGTCS